MTEISDFQRANLEKLAAYLEGLPEDYQHFDMGDFHSKHEEPTEYAHSCGAVACAVGHGPLAGVESLPSDKSWCGYSGRVFLPVEHDAWEWCFDSAWMVTDNTPHGAAKRIRWYLKNGLPSDWYDQMTASTPLCYKESA